MTKKVFAWLYIVIVLAVLYAPILLIVVFSFSEANTVTFSDFQFGFGLYKDLFESAGIMNAVGNSLIIAFSSALISTVLGTVACVGINAMKRRWRSVFMTVNQVPIINADIITSLSLAILFLQIGMTNSNGYVKLIFAHTVICLPFVLLSVMPRLRQLNPNLYEAAQDLGANPFLALVKVLIPQLLPGMLAGFMLGFTLSLDDYIITLFNSGNVETISTIVYNSAAKKGVPPEYRALSSIVFLVVMAIAVAINIKNLKKQKRNH